MTLYNNQITLIINIVPEVTQDVGLNIQANSLYHIFETLLDTDVITNKSVVIKKLYEIINRISIN